MSSLLEIACFNPESVRIAAFSGAQRIEFCSDYHVGGLSPRPQELQDIKEKIKIPVYVMVRPRPGNFNCTDEEFENFKQQILNFKSLGADGFVFGILNEDNTLDFEKCKTLVELANPLPCTLHRAFDETPDLETALENAIAIGFKNILTSGGKANAIQNLERLHSLHELANGNITLIAGGGIRSGNIAEIKNKTGIKEFHSSAIKDFDRCLPDTNEIKRLISELT